MKAIGIVVEYNPFHNGHLYHIEKIKEKYPDYYIIAVMSGNFTQRGEVCVIDKYKRVKSALINGVDLVVELPFPFATQSADYFAYASITILEHLKCEKVIFGSESNDLEHIKKIAKIQLNNDEFDTLVKIYLKMGETYPNALKKAYLDLGNEEIKEPNDLLAISYVKTIYKNNYKIIPESIKRDNSYHSKELNNSISSATSIREALKDNKDISQHIPKNTIKEFTSLHFIDDYFHILKYKIITSNNLEIYQTVSKGYNKRIKNCIKISNNYKELIINIKQKHDTYNKIQRMLLHILCNFTKEKAKEYSNIKYIRILGLNNNGKKYLNSIKKYISIPIISKIKKEKDSMLTYELETTKIYDLFSNNLEKQEYDDLPIIITEKN